MQNWEETLPKDMMAAPASPQLILEQYRLFKYILAKPLNHACIARV